LLEKLLEITESEHGSIGEIPHTEQHVPCLETFAIANIAWNYETRKFCKENMRSGLEFFNLGTLFGITIRSGETVISNNPSEDPRSGGLPRGPSAAECLPWCSLCSGNKLIGMAGVANRVGGHD
jgi:hypothetical protein